MSRRKGQDVWQDIWIAGHELGLRILPFVLDVFC